MILFYSNYILNIATMHLIINIRANLTEKILLIKGFMTKEILFQLKKLLKNHLCLYMFHFMHFQMILLSLN